MEDSAIVDLYWERSESAIRETDVKYGKYCHVIAYNILCSDMDAEECVNDTYVKAWNAIPPQKPNSLSAFLGRITRNLALNRYHFDRAKKRSINMELVYEELKDVLKDPITENTPEETIVLRDAIRSFVASLPMETRILFVRRYWYISSIKDIARDYGIPEGTVKSILSRARKQLREQLEKEGIGI